MNARQQFRKIIREQTASQLRAIRHILTSDPRPEARDVIAAIDAELERRRQARQLMIARQRAAKLN